MSTESKPGRNEPPPGATRIDLTPEQAAALTAPHVSSLPGPLTDEEPLRGLLMSCADFPANGTINVKACVLRGVAEVLTLLQAENTALRALVAYNADLIDGEEARRLCGLNLSEFSVFHSRIITQALDRQRQQAEEQTE